MHIEDRTYGPLPDPPLTPSPVNADAPEPVDEVPAEETVH